MTERQKTILRLLSENQELTVADLSRDLNVSGVTIRQDLEYLQSQRLLRRIHGGAILNNEDEISIRIGINFERKLHIAEYAADMVEPGETIFIESGSVNAIFAQQLKTMTNLQVVTNNVFTARTLKDSSVDVILIGGLYQHDSESLVGTVAQKGLANFNFSKCFIGIDGFDFESAFTSSDMMRAEVAALAVAKSPEVFVLTDSSKFGRRALSYICNVSDVHHVVTDSQIPEDYRSFLTSANITLHVCP